MSFDRVLDICFQGAAAPQGGALSLVGVLRFPPDLELAQKPHDLRDSQHAGTGASPSMGSM